MCWHASRSRTFLLQQPFIILSCSFKLTIGSDMDTAASVIKFNSRSKRYSWLSNFFPDTTAGITDFDIQRALKAYYSLPLLKEKPQQRNYDRGLKKRQRVSQSYKSPSDVEEEEKVETAVLVEEEVRSPLFFSWELEGSEDDDEEDGYDDSVIVQCRSNRPRRRDSENVASNDEDAFVKDESFTTALTKKHFRSVEHEYMYRKYALIAPEYAEKVILPMINRKSKDIKTAGSLGKGPSSSTTRASSSSSGFLAWQCNRLRKEYVGTTDGEGKTREEGEEEEEGKAQKMMKRKANPTKTELMRQARAVYDKGQTKFMEVNTTLMFRCLWHKFENPVLRQLLLETGDKALHEAGRPSYWTSSGADALGKLLMHVRASIRANKTLDEAQKTLPEMSWKAAAAAGGVVS